MDRPPLDYDIVDVSSSLKKFSPENIKVNTPFDQMSRWSSDSQNSPQYLVLRLNRPAIVHAIYFGKHERPSPCNVKSMRIWGGISSNCSALLYYGGLHNDSTAETINLRYKTHDNQQLIACQYIKLECLETYGTQFNFTLWYVRLLGDDEPSRINAVVKNMETYKYERLIRACTKYLREHDPNNENLENLSNHIESVTGIKMEDARLAKLRETLVEKADFDASENLLLEYARDELLYDRISREPYITSWLKISATSQQRSPAPRGGHQMCLDPDNRRLYLFGGCDGSTDLSDFWVYDLRTSIWECLSEDTAQDNGPVSRSCHRMVYDRLSKQLFILGRYVYCAYPSSRLPPSNDFYAYDTTSHQWSILSDDTAREGGPPLIYDHQMAIDSIGRTIYVSGGRLYAPPLANNTFLPLYLRDQRPGQRTNAPDLPLLRRNLITARSNQNFLLNESIDSDDASVDVSVFNKEALYSGLYAYHIPTNSWQQLRCDMSELILPGRSVPNYETSRQNDFDLLKICFKGRTGHSMLFDGKHRCLYILGGQRRNTSFREILRYDCEQNTLNYIYDETQHGTRTIVTLPTVGCTQRATIDSFKQEIYVLSCNNKIGSGQSLVRTGAIEYPNLTPRARTPAFLSSQCQESELLSQAQYKLQQRQSATNTALRNSLWVFNIEKLTWNCVFENAAPHPSKQCSTSMSEVISRVLSDVDATESEPSARYAHQLIYDDTTHTHYLFGGNPGRNANNTRLDDFWQLNWRALSVDTLVTSQLWSVRETQFLTLLDQTKPIEALMHIQTKMDPLVTKMEALDMKDAADKRKMLHELVTRIFDTSSDKSTTSSSDVARWRSMRQTLFYSLCTYYPQLMQPPAVNIAELIPF